MRRRWNGLCGSVVLSCAAASAAAQSAPDLLQQEWRDGKYVNVSSDAFVEGRRRLDDGSSTELTLVRSKLRARLSDAHDINPTLGIDSTHLEIGHPAGPVRLPGQLDDVSAVLAAPLFGEEKWFVGGSVGAGYAGSGAFGEGNALYVMGSVMYGRELANGDQVLFLVDYDGNRTLWPDVPIPSFAYQSEPLSWLSYTLGVPYSDIEIRPTQEWRLTLTYQFPVNAAVEVAYRPAEEIELFGRFSNNEDAFHASGMPEDRRLFYEESRAELGANWDVTEDLRLTVAGGYAFERSFSTGFDDRDLHHLSAIEDGPYARIGLTLGL